VIERFAHDALRSVVYSDDPVLLLFGDLPDDLARGREAAARAGCHVADAAPITEGIDRLERQIAVDIVLLFARAPGDALDRLLDRLTSEARAGRLAAVIVAPDDMVDSVARPGFHPRVEHLFDPDQPALVAAIANASAPAAARVHDINRDADTNMLQQLSEDAARIATILASMSDAPLARAHPETDTGDQAGAEAGHVRSIIRARRLREQFFRSELFADPAFDMLLDLYASRLEGNRVAVSSLCIAASVPPTTALRWIKALTDRGLFVRSADPQDGRRVYIELSNDCARAMGRYLRAVQRAGIPAI
jgi:hypothetical protein